MLDNSFPHLQSASVCPSQTLGQKSHLCPHPLKTSGIVKGSWSLSVVKITSLLVQIMGLPG